MLKMFQGTDKLPVIILFFASSIRYFNPTLNSLVLFLIIPCLLLYCTKRYNVTKIKTLELYKYIFVWFCVTTIISSDIIFSIGYLKTLVGGFFISIIFYILAIRRVNNTYWLLSSYILLLFSSLLYLYKSGSLLVIDISSERLDGGDMVNANDIAYFLFYTTVAITIIIDDLKIGKLISVLLFISLISLILVMSSLTASRQLLIVVLPFCLFSVYYKFFFNKVSIKAVVVIACLVLCLYVLATYFVSNIYEGSLLEKRFSGDIKEDSRTNVLYEAIAIGISHPIFGVGSGCFFHYSSDGAFSHNAYSEIFACSGLPALVLYMRLLYLFCKKQYIRYKKTRIPIFFYLFGTFIVWDAYNFLYVFYSNLWLIGFVFILDAYSDNIYNKLLINRN